MKTINKIYYALFCALLFLFLQGCSVKKNITSDAPLKDIEISEMAFDILNGCNVNEVMVVQKNTKKLGFFEKFFQLFS